MPDRGLFEVLLYNNGGDEVTLSVEAEYEWQYGGGVSEWGILDATVTAIIEPVEDRTRRELGLWNMNPRLAWVKDAVLEQLNDPERCAPAPVGHEPCDVFVDA